MIFTSRYVNVQIRVETRSRALFDSYELIISNVSRSNERDANNTRFNLSTMFS